MSNRRMPLVAANLLATGGQLLRVRADGVPDVSAEIKKIVGDFTAGFTAFKEAQAVADAAFKTSLEATGVDVKKALEEANAASAKVAGIAATLTEIEQKLVDKLTDGQHVPAATVGAIVVASDEYKALALAPGQTPGASFKLRVEANTLSGQTGSPPENTDTLVPVDRRAGITPGAFRALRIVDFLPNIPTTSNAWQFVRELLWTNNAAETAEGAAKPESVLTFEDVTVNIRTIAHFIKASNQILADAPALAAYIDTRLRHGVDAREDSQLINGNGSGQNISGMTLAGNYTAFTPTSGDTAIDSINRAKYAIVGADYQPTAILMNPADWGAIERLKTSDLGYVVGNPFGSIIPIMWGLPVIVSNNMPSGYFLMADFATSYEYLSRQSTTIDVGYVNDDFTKNLVTIRGEKRSALATIRPASTRYGALTL